MSKPWTSVEIGQAARMRAEGATYAGIAIALGRSRYSIAWLAKGGYLMSGNLRRKDRDRDPLGAGDLDTRIKAEEGSERLRIAITDHLARGWRIRFEDAERLLMGKAA